MWNRGRRRGTLAILLLGSAVALASCGSGGPGQQREEKPPPITVLKPTAQSPFDRRFSWQPLEGVTSYRVIVFNSAGDRTFEVRDVRGTTVALAESVVLAPGEYSWQVLAFRDGNQISQSAVTPFTLK